MKLKIGQKVVWAGDLQGYLLNKNQKESAKWYGTHEGKIIDKKSPGKLKGFNSEATCLVRWKNPKHHKFFDDREKLEKEIFEEQEVTTWIIESYLLPKEKAQMQRVLKNL